MKRSLCTLLALGSVALVPAATMRAAAPASDNAGNYTGGYSNGNSGTGFLAFVTATSGTNSGTFLGDSTTNGNGFNSTGINTGNPAQAFGLFANSGETVTVNRSFTAGGPNGTNVLAIGQTFQLSLDNGSVDAGGNVGFNLFNAGGTARLTLKFVGGANDYVYNIGGADIDTGVGFTANGLAIAFTQGAANAFTLRLTPGGGATTTITGTTAGTDITQFQVFNTNAGNNGDHNLFFNSVAVVPEPTTFGTLSVAVLGFLGVRRLRRTK